VVQRLGPAFPKWIPHQHISLFDHEVLPRIISELPRMTVEAVGSFTPWELSMKGVLARLPGRARELPRFSLVQEMSTENSRPYRLYPLRRVANQAWARLTMKRHLRGELMYVAARKLSANLAKAGLLLAGMAPELLLDLTRSIPLASSHRAATAQQSCGDPIIAPTAILRRSIHSAPQKQCSMAFLRQANPWIVRMRGMRT
jgi:hypothetical protein